MRSATLVLALAGLARASEVSIAGYEPGSDVTSHNALDLDQKELESALKASDYTLAELIYTQGGNSGGKVKLTIASPGLTAAVAKSELVKVGTTVLKAKSAAAQGATELTAYYGDGSVDTTCTRSVTTGCVASGSLTTSAGAALGTITAGVNSYRTLQGFSTAAPAKMDAGWSSKIPGAQKYYQEMKDVYGTGTYADDMISSVISTPASGSWAGIDAPALADARAQLVKKGTVFLSVWLYVIREFEDAVDDCTEGDINANDAPVHAWDEGVAFYTGTLEGIDPGGHPSDGKMLHNLADKRCQNYGTCTSDTDGDPFKGRSEVNAELFTLFAVGRTHMQQGLCSFGVDTKNRIAEIMTIPMVQGALRYAYKLDKLGGGSEEAAEGHIFSMASIGRVNSCSAPAAQTIKENTWMTVNKFDKATGLMADGFPAVYEAFKSTYQCLNIKCTDIGGLVESKGATLAESSYYEGFEPCVDKSGGGGDDDDDDAAWMMPVMAVLAVGFVVSLGLYIKSCQGQPKAAVTGP